ncbi:MAG: hypothetical protein ACYC4Q_12475, partial [Victivallaceae bacterium]
MKTEKIYKPVFILLARSFRLIAENIPTQRDSRIYKLKAETENSLPQQDSKISILKTSPAVQLAVRLVPQSGDPYCLLAFKNHPVQQDSRIYKLKAETENSLPRRGSRISILKTSPTGQLAVRLVPPSGDPFCLL